MTNIILSFFFHSLFFKEKHFQKVSIEMKKVRSTFLKIQKQSTVISGGCHKLYPPPCLEWCFGHYNAEYIYFLPKTNEN